MAVKGSVGRCLPARRGRHDPGPVLRAVTPAARRGPTSGAADPARPRPSRSRPSRGVLGRRDRPGHQASCCSTLRRHRTGATDLLDLGCGYGPIAVDAGPPGPRRHGVGRRRQRAGRRPAPAQRGAAGLDQRARRCRRERLPDRRRVRRHLQQPARSGSARPPCTTCCSRWLPRLGPAATPTSSCRSTSAPTRWPRWLGEQGWPTDSARVRGRLPTARSSIRPQTPQ